MARRRRGCRRRRLADRAPSTADDVPSSVAGEGTIGTGASRSGHQDERDDGRAEHDEHGCEQAGAGEARRSLRFEHSDDSRRASSPMRAVATTAPATPSPIAARGGAAATADRAALASSRAVSTAVAALSVCLTSRAAAKPASAIVTAATAAARTPSAVTVGRMARSTRSRSGCGFGRDQEVLGRCRSRAGRVGDRRQALVERSHASHELLERRLHARGPVGERQRVVAVGHRAARQAGVRSRFSASDRAGSGGGGRQS